MIFGLCCLVFINCICHIAFTMGTTSVEKFKLEKDEKARKVMKKLDLVAYTNRLKVIK